MEFKKGLLLQEFILKALRVYLNQDAVSLIKKFLLSCSTVTAQLIKEFFSFRHYVVYLYCSSSKCHNFLTKVELLLACCC